MDASTVLMLSHQRTDDLRREAAHHRLAKLVATSVPKFARAAVLSSVSSGQRTPQAEQVQDSHRTDTFASLHGDSHRRLSTLTKELS